MSLRRADKLNRRWVEMLDLPDDFFSQQFDRFADLESAIVRAARVRSADTRFRVPQGVYVHGTPRNPGSPETDADRLETWNALTSFLAAPSHDLRSQTVFALHGDQNYGAQLFVDAAIQDYIARRDSRGKREGGGALAEPHLAVCCLSLRDFRSDADLLKALEQFLEPETDQGDGLIEARQEALIDRLERTPLILALASVDTLEAGTFAAMPRVIQSTGVHRLVLRLIANAHEASRFILISDRPLPHLDNPFFKDVRRLRGPAPETGGIDKIIEDNGLHTLCEGRLAEIIKEVDRLPGEVLLQMTRFILDAGDRASAAEPAVPPDTGRGLTRDAAGEPRMRRIRAALRLNSPVGVVADFLDAADNVSVNGTSLRDIICAVAIADDRLREKTLHVLLAEWRSGPHDGRDRAPHPDALKLVRDFEAKTDRRLLWTTTLKEPAYTGLPEENYIEMDQSLREILLDHLDSEPDGDLRQKMRHLRRVIARSARAQAVRARQQADRPFGAVADDLRRDVLWVHQAIASIDRTALRKELAGDQAVDASHAADDIDHADFGRSQRRTVRAAYNAVRNDIDGKAYRLTKELGEDRLKLELYLSFFRMGRARHERRIRIGELSRDRPHHDVFLANVPGLTPEQNVDLFLSIAIASLRSGDIDLAGIALDAVRLLHEERLLADATSHDLDRLARAWKLRLDLLASIGDLVAMEEEARRSLSALDLVIRGHDAARGGSPGSRGPLSALADVGVDLAGGLDGLGEGLKPVLGLARDRKYRDVVRAGSQLLAREAHRLALLDQDERAWSLYAAIEAIDMARIDGGDETGSETLVGYPGLRFVEDILWTLPEDHDGRADRLKRARDVQDRNTRKLASKAMELHRLRIVEALLAAAEAKHFGPEGRSDALAGTIMLRRKLVHDGVSDPSIWLQLQLATARILLDRPDGTPPRPSPQRGNRDQAVNLLKQVERRLALDGRTAEKIAPRRDRLHSIDTLTLLAVSDEETASGAYRRHARLAMRDTGYRLPERWLNA